MSLGVLGLVLLAAWAHAAWNLVAKGAQGGAAFVWLTTVASAVLYAPVLVGGIDLAPAAIALMAGSGALHAAYFVLLQRGYATGDLSLVYPLARGTGPLLSSVAAIAFLGEHPSPLAIAGAAVIVGAVFSLAWMPARRRHRRRRVRPAHRCRDRGLHALGQAGGRRTRARPADLLLGDQPREPALHHAVDPLRRDRWRWPGTPRGGGPRRRVCFPTAYILVLYALVRAPVSYAAPARETSILLATGLGLTMLGEGDARRRAVAAAAIVVGITLLALG